MGMATDRLLSQIHSPDSPSSRISALRALKNELVGHDQRKQSWIESGVVPALAQVLATRRELDGAPATALDPGLDVNRQTPDIQTVDDAACLQTAVIVGCLAQGGPAYISPLLSGDVMPSLLAILSSSTCPQSLTVAVLQTLNAIADRIPFGYEVFDQQAKHLAGFLFSKENIACLCTILDRTPDSYSVQLSIDLAADLVAKLSIEQSHRLALAEAGVLDILAEKLAAFVVAQGFVLPGAERCANSPGALGAIPPPAPASARLAPILHAINVLISGSKSRAEHFLSSPGIQTVFPKRIPQLQSPDAKKSPWGASSYFPPSRSSPTNPIDSLLPSVPIHQGKGSSNFPPLGSGASYSKPGQFFSPSLPFSDSPASEEDESALVPWLFHLARSEPGLIKVRAARLIATLFRCGLAKKQRMSMMAYLLIPILLRMLDKDFDDPGENPAPGQNSLVSPPLRLKEEAPAVLAALIMESRELQKSAVDGGAVKKLSQLLKGTFSGGASWLEKPMWWPSKNQHVSYDPARSEYCLGSPGFPPLIMHKMKFREALLKAVAALSLFKEEYRKAVCDNGVVPYIIDSMKPYEPEAISPDSESKAAEYLELNPIPTLMAACAAARSLTRSVSVLRTSLIDAGVAMPIFTLAKFRDIDVQIAATSVICNLAMDFSPMKEAVIGANMIPTLCEHAHSSNTKLRLECLWALKHIAYNSTNDIKMKIVEKLEPGWLKQVICQDAANSLGRKRTEDDLTFTPTIEMTTPGQVGEPVDSLSTPNGGSASSDPMKDPEPEEASNGHRMSEPLLPPKATQLDVFASGNARRRKLALNGDLDHTKQARRDDIHVQEQTLDLIRNLICGTGASEMIDYVFRELGQNELFDILADKLRPKPLSSFGRRDSMSSKTIPVPPEILCSVTYILIHLAAGLSRHRQLLILHRDLLRLMIPLFNHSDKQIRVNCVWVVINLTFQDDQSDQKDCLERAIKLKSLGTTERLASLEEDPESDVRERTKTAVSLMNALV